MKMLESEGFRFDRYVDIFDGGPTVTAPTDEIRTVRDAQSLTVAEIGEGGTQKMIVAAGQLESFRACFTSATVSRGRITLDPEAAALLEVGEGEDVAAVSR